MAVSSALSECRATACHARVLPYVLFCDRCWPAIPADIKRLIEKHHRPRKRASQLLEKFIAMAVADLLELRTTGRHIPTPAEFMWDDEPQAPVGVDEPLFPEFNK